MPRRGRVFFDRDPVGWIEEAPDGMAFVYDPEWLARRQARPASLTLPLRPEPYSCRGLHPFFAGLLPEGWLFDIALATLKLPADDGFGLVLALCRDCVGAAWIEPEAAAEGSGTDG